MANRCDECCPHSQRLDTLWKKVIEGNGDASLQDKVRRQGEQLSDLQTIVKGDGETTGLQPHMIGLQAGLRFVKWEIGVGLVVLGLLITLFGVLMTMRAGDHRPGVAMKFQPSQSVAASTAVAVPLSPRGTTPAR